MTENSEKIKEKNYEIYDNFLKDYLNEFTENEKVSKVKINSDYNFTDTRTKKYRYQIVAEIWHY